MIYYIAVQLANAACTEPRQNTPEQVGEVGACLSRLRDLKWVPAKYGCLAPPTSTQQCTSRPPPGRSTEVLRDGSPAERMRGVHTPWGG
jgi:hypothetical protein